MTEENREVDLSKKNWPQRNPGLAGFLLIAAILLPGMIYRCNKDDVESQSRIQEYARQHAGDIVTQTNEISHVPLFGAAATKPLPVSQEAIKRRLMKPKFLDQAPCFKWERADLNDGVERWFGQGKTCLIIIHRDFVEVTAGMVETAMIMNSMLLFCEVNAVLFPDTYQECNADYLLPMLKSVVSDTDTDTPRVNEYRGYRMEVAANTTLGMVFYTVGRNPYE
ncbi:hypothetical protein M0R72_08145 [Candidatus Pacearchaeota archaeon]|jgi:hypothetical protein|nr:hypothetical protein [Candidatus Pacearchaeota archaeon]